MDENIQGLITSESLDDGEDDDYKDDEIPLSELEYSQSVEITHELGVDWPIINQKYLKQFIEYLNKFNYFD